MPPPASSAHTLYRQKLEFLDYTFAADSKSQSLSSLIPKDVKFALRKVQIRTQWLFKVSRGHRFPFKSNARMRLSNYLIVIEVLSVYDSSEIRTAT